MPNTAKYKQIADEIEAQIRSGELHDGDALPSINSYADKEDINRSTVKRAYDQLCNRGLAISIPGKGYYVITPENTIKDESSDLRVFWSYAHKDDEHTNGAITKLRERIQAEYEFQTGSEANIFQDTKDIDWGANWRTTIGQSLGVTTFFVPILTPTYLRSPNCLTELRTAKTRFEQLGFEEGIYPIEIVDCTKAIELLNDDALANLLSDTQRDRSWIDLRFEDPQSKAYSIGVQKIVQTMIEKEDLWHEEVEKTFQDESENDDQDGLLEKMAMIMESLDETKEIGHLIGNDFEAIGAVFSDHPAPSNATPKMMLASAATLAHNLDNPSKTLEKHSKEFSLNMNTVGQGLDGFIELCRVMHEITGESYEAELNGLHSTVVGIPASCEDSFSQINQLRPLIRQTAQLSRSIRKPCQRIDVALENIISGVGEIEGWERKLREAMQEVKQ